MENLQSYPQLLLFGHLRDRLRRSAIGLRFARRRDRSPRPRRYSDFKRNYRSRQFVQTEQTERYGNYRRRGYDSCRRSADSEQMAYARLVLHRDRHCSDRRRYPDPDRKILILKIRMNEFHPQKTADRF